MAHVRPTLVLLALLTVLTGGVYPGAVTLAAQGLFPFQAHGSILRANGRALGSAQIGQPFSASGYFWGRPSATTPGPYDAASSGGSNLGPLNPALLDAVRARVAALRAADPGRSGPVPVDLVTASGSGLDPDVSLAGALYQVPRVARARGLPEDRLRALVAAHVEGRALGLFGEPHVNVLLLNLDLDRIAPAKG
jgi:K+-transporting ATPase ATPase C chain